MRVHRDENGNESVVVIDIENEAPGLCGLNAPYKIKSALDEYELDTITPFDYYIGDGRVIVYYKKGFPVPENDGIVEKRTPTHGDPMDTHKMIAALLSAYLDVAIQPHEVSVIMILMKIARSACGDWKNKDHAVDIAGYADIFRMFQEKEKNSGR